MILASKMLWPQEVWSNEHRSPVRFYTVQQFVEDVKGAAIRSGLVDDGAQERFGDNTLEFMSPLYIRVQPAFSLSCDLTFDFVSPDRYSVHSPHSKTAPERPDGSAWEPATAVLYDLKVSVSTPSFGGSLSETRAKTRLMTELAEFGEFVVARFDRKIGVLTDPNAEAFAALETEPAALASV